MDIAQPHWNAWLPWYCVMVVFFPIIYLEFPQFEAVSMVSCTLYNSRKFDFFTLFFSHKNELWPVISPPLKTLSFIAAVLITMVNSSFLKRLLLMTWLSITQRLWKRLHLVKSVISLSKVKNQCNIYILWASTLGYDFLINPGHTSTSLQKEFLLGCILYRCKLSSPY